MTDATPGRRDRNKAAKRATIIDAAARLFARQGFGATTTQQVAEEADVAEGTLFRYASTKQELLLMVVNEHLRPLVEKGADAPTTDAEAEILRLLGPLISLAEGQPGNAAPYLREVLFGEGGTERAQSLALVDQMVARIASVLAPYTADAEMPADEAARWVFSALVSELLRGAALGVERDGQSALRARVRVLLRGLGAA